jgi:thiol-disulfide isomerase/thioredoxin
MFCLGLLLSTAPTATCASLGDKAPPVTVERWIKGAPVRIGPGPNVFVVEFWATWCGPCKRSIPHLTELQAKYKDRGLVIVGVSDEPAADVIPFVASQGGAMDYRVAVDTSRRTFNNWMPAYGENGIPHSFVIGTNGLVLWHGFPSEELDRTLEHVFSGKFDLEFEKNSETGDRLVQYYTAMAKKPNATGAIAPTGEKILADYCRDWRVAYRLARSILTDPEVRSRDVPLALRVANRAVELTHQRSYQALEMQARALFASGKRTEAIEIQKQAISVCSDPEDRPELEKFLLLFQKSAGNEPGVTKAKGGTP